MVGRCWACYSDWTPSSSKYCCQLLLSWAATSPYMARTPSPDCHFHPLRQPLLTFGKSRLPIGLQQAKLALADPLGCAVITVPLDLFDPAFDFGDVGPYRRTVGLSLEDIDECLVAGGVPIGVEFDARLYSGCSHRLITILARWPGQTYILLIT